MIRFYYKTVNVKSIKRMREERHVMTFYYFTACLIRNLMNRWTRRQRIKFVHVSEDEVFILIRGLQQLLKILIAPV